MAISHANLDHRVAFHETDMAGIVHFSNFFRYFEMAEHHLFREAGLTVHGEIDGKIVGWPRVNVSASFGRPVKFEDTIRISIHIVDKGEKRLTFVGAIYCADQLMASGKSTSVCVSLNADGKLGSLPMPESINSALCVDTDTDLSEVYALLERKSS